MIKIFNSKKFFILIISIFTFFFYIKNINYDNLWFDEILSFWISDPSINISETFIRHWSIEQLPPLYNLLLKYIHLFFGYDPNVGRYLSAIFGTLSIIIIPLILNNYEKREIFIIFFMLCFTNVFIYKFSQEMRPYSMFLFFSTINLFFAEKIINNQKEFTTKNLLLFSITNILLILTHVFGLILFFSLVAYYFFYFIKYKKIYLKILYLIFINLFIIFLLAITYFYNVKSFPAWIENINYKFFFNFYFSKFFGSRLVGILFLVALIYCFFLEKNKIVKNNFFIFLLIIILFSYILPILYGVFYKPILNERYIIFVIIPILILIVNILSKKTKKKLNYFFLLLLLIVSIGNSFTETNFNQFFKEREKHKPDYEKILNIINKSNYNSLSLNIENRPSQNAVFNYLNQISVKNNLKKINYIYNYKDSNNIWILCDNYCYNIDILSKNFIIKNEFFANKLHLVLIKKITNE